MEINQSNSENWLFKKGERHLFILPCCKRKNRISVNCTLVPPTFFFNVAQVPEVKNLMDNRATNIANNPNAIEMPNISNKALDLYDGQLYRRLKEHQGLITEKMDDGKLDIIIVSALYGVVNYDSCIVKYDLEMDDPIVNYWGDSIRKAILKYIEVNKFDRVHSFLRPTTYHMAATNNTPLHAHHEAYWSNQVGGNAMRGNYAIYNNVADKAISILRAI